MSAAEGDLIILIPFLVSAPTTRLDTPTGRKLGGKSIVAARLQRELVCDLVV
ncbi:hypothetical protein ACXR8U_06865 [Methylobacterium radiotolerans]